VFVVKSKLYTNSSLISKPLFQPPLSQGLLWYKIYIFSKSIIKIWNKSALENTFLLFAISVPSCHVTIPLWHIFPVTCFRNFFNNRGTLLLNRGTIFPEPDFKLTLTNHLSIIVWVIHFTFQWNINHLFFVCVNPSVLREKGFG